MLEGIYFQFPKLGFLLFFFLACEALCPLRSNPLYFPRPFLFGEVGVKPPVWLWISKWMMITFLIIALMSPVRDHTVPVEEGGWDILVIIDPVLTEEPNLFAQIQGFVGRRPHERIALWIPDDTIVPLTYEHEALIGALKQTPKHESAVSGNLNPERFFATSGERAKLAVIVSELPQALTPTLPISIQTVRITSYEQQNWADDVNRDYPPYLFQPTHRYYDYYYVYPLMLGFVAMLLYLYGRNQKGLR